jgi:type VI secretion system protein ImpF
LESFTGSLLDRLSNRSTTQVAAVTVNRGELQAASLEESILRNLNWLLSTTRLEASIDLSRWPNVRQSVLNFGIPELSGQHLSSTDIVPMQRQLAEAISRFEPRLHKETVSVQVVVDKSRMNRQAVTLIIAGDFGNWPLRQTINITVEVDVESGKVSEIKE